MYKLTSSEMIFNLETQSYILPENPNYLAWLAEGNTPEPVTVVPVDISALRSSAYKEESDPLFFKSQRGEGTIQDWLDKVAEIKSRYPKAVEENSNVANSI